MVIFLFWTLFYLILVSGVSLSSKNKASSDRVQPNFIYKDNQHEIKLIIIITEILKLMDNAILHI